MMALRPLGSHVVVEPSEAEQTTASGIVIPDAAQEQPTQGRVIAAGPGSIVEGGLLEPPGVLPGDVVVYGRYAGTKIRHGGREVLLLTAKDLLAVVEDD